MVCAPLCSVVHSFVRCSTYYSPHRDPSYHKTLPPPVTFELQIVYVCFFALQHLQVSQRVFHVPTARKTAEPRNRALEPRFGLFAGSQGLRLYLTRTLCENVREKTEIPIGLGNLALGARFPKEGGEPGRTLAGR